VSEGFDRIYKKRKNIICWVSQKVGLSLRVDGDANAKLDIKGFSGLEIGNCREDIGITPPEVDILEDKNKNLNMEFIDT